MNEKKWRKGKEMLQVEAIVKTVNSICKIIINEIEVGYGFFCKICHREKSNILPFGYWLFIGD